MQEEVTLQEASAPQEPAAKQKPASPKAEILQKIRDEIEAERPNTPLPKTYGLTLEEARTLLVNSHDWMCDKDDPFLMICTLLNAYLDQISKMQTRHEEALGRLMADKADAYVGTVQGTVRQLTESLSSASIEAIRVVFERHGQELTRFKNNLLWASVVVALSAVVNLIFYIIGGR